MLEQEFEKAKQQLLALLPDYLSSKGININANFSCFNPEDKARVPTMTYSKDKNVVSCFHCKKTYNIFDLIGIEYGILDFSHQFTKAHEIYIGKVPLGYIEILKKQAISDLTPPQGFSKPSFEIAQDRAMPKLGQSLPPQMQNNSGPLSQLEGLRGFGFADQDDLVKKMPESQESISFNTISPFDEARLKPFNTRSSAPSNGSVPAFAQPNFGAPQNQNAPQFSQANRSLFGFSEVSNNTPRFGESQNSGFQNYSSDSAASDFSDYINQCAANVSKSAYFTDRGLSDAVIHRFKLGIDEHFQAEPDAMSGQRVWKAAIIPYGVHGYCVRNTESTIDEKRDRYKKKGSFDIFNHEALDQPGTIFITEGEFDALSIETLGYRAIALGGASNIRLLVDTIRDCKEEHKYYLCLDNDEAGNESAKQIVSQLYQLNISVQNINIAHPYKDINEALCKAPEGLKNRIANLDRILTFSLESLSKNEPETKYIQNEFDVKTLMLSPALYSMSATPQVLRRFVSDIIKHRQQAIVYAAPRASWNYLCRFITAQGKEFDSAQWNTLRYLELNDEDIETRIFSCIESLVLKGNSAFVTVVDLCSCQGKELETTLEKLSRLCQTNGVGLMVLCSDSQRAAAEGAAIQNLDIEVNEAGDFIVSTLDGLCRRTAFAIPKI